MPKFDSIEHLNFEAVAALIDDELTPTAYHRAQNHLARCEDCRREVAQQRAASEAVREHNTDGCLRAPRSLVEKLSHLDDQAPLTRVAAENSGGKWPISWSRLRNGLR